MSERTYNGEQAIGRLVTPPIAFGSEPAAVFTSGRLVTRIGWHSIQCRLLAKWLGMLSNDVLLTTQQGWLRQALAQHITFLREAATAFSNALLHCRSLQTPALMRAAHELHYEVTYFNRLHRNYEYVELPWTHTDLNDNPVSERLAQLCGDEYSLGRIPARSYDFLVYGKSFENGICPLFRIAHKCETYRSRARYAIHKTSPRHDRYKNLHVIPDYLPCELMPSTGWPRSLRWLCSVGCKIPPRKTGRLISQIQKQILARAAPRPCLWTLVAQLLDRIDRALAECKLRTKRKAARKKIYSEPSSIETEWDKEEGWANVTTEQGYTIHFRRNEGKVVYQNCSTVLGSFQSGEVFSTLLDYLQKNRFATKDDLRGAWESDPDDVYDNTIEQQVSSIRECFRKGQVPLDIKCRPKFGYKLVDITEIERSSPVRTRGLTRKRTAGMTAKRSVNAEDLPSVQPHHKELGDA